MARPIVWPLVADPRGWNRGFDQAERRGQRFQRHIQGLERSNTRFSASFGRVGPVAVRAIGGATVAIGGLAAAGAVLGLKTAANLETAEVGFTRLLKSGKRARDFLGDLKSFAARTPFELPGLVDAARGLVGAGTAAKDVIPILTALGDASGALGLDQERFGRVMVATTQIMNKGKVQAEELMQITEAGIPVWQLLAKATGKPVPELQKLMQQGKLLASDVLPALFTQMRKDYGGGMAQQSKTLNGLWSTFKDTLSLTLADGLNPLIPVLKTALPKAGEAFQRSVEGITGFFRDDLGPELGRVRQAWDDNESSILGFVGSLTGSQSSMQSSADAARGLGDAMTRLVEASGAVARGGIAFGDWLNRQKAGLDEGSIAIHDKLIAPLSSAALKVGEFFGLRPIGPLQGVAEHLSSTTAELAGNTSDAATAAQRHADAMRAQKQAMDALRGSLDDEKGAELNLRQAKLNVATAQDRLNELKKTGKTRSTEYKQAQLNLERAQLALEEATGDYRVAVNKSNEAERVAAFRAAATKAALDKLKLTSIGARTKLVQFALDSSAAIKELKSRSLTVTANYNIGAPKGIELLIEKGLVRREGGGEIPGPGPRGKDSRLVWMAPGEHVWTDREVIAAGGHGAMARWRRAVLAGEAPEFAAGGGLDLRMPGAAAFKARPGRFQRNLDRSMDASARGFGQWAQSFAAFPPHVPGGWKIALEFLRGLGIAFNVVSTFRPGARTRASGSVSYHALNRAVDLGGPDMLGIWSALTRTNPTELIYSRAPQYKSRRGWRPIGALDPITRADHFSHVHAAYDRGGWLMPGTTVATNRTGRPEPVGFDYTALAEAIVAALRRHPPTVAVTDLDAGVRAYQRNRGKPVIGFG